jgi:putative phosphoesterase
MRLAIVSDVHGNYTALEAVVTSIERHGIDRVVHGGDLALGGCQPAEVIDLVRELGWPGVVGNTDEILWRPQGRAEQERAAPKLVAQLRLLYDVYAPATTALVGRERVAWLQGLAEQHRADSMLVVHASPASLWRAPDPDAGDDELTATYGSCGADMVVYGHIHRPFVRHCGALTVANAGSVGSSFDGDARASYLVVDDAAARVVRVEYDVEREADRLLRSGYPDAARIAQMRRGGAFVAVST